MIRRRRLDFVTRKLIIFETSRAQAEKDVLNTQNVRNEIDMTIRWMDGNECTKGR